LTLEDGGGGSQRGGRDGGEGEGEHLDDRGGVEKKEEEGEEASKSNFCCREALTNSETIRLASISDYAAPPENAFGCPKQLVAVSIRDEPEEREVAPASEVSSVGETGIESDGAA
jgi:hypothetical protein